MTQDLSFAASAAYNAEAAKIIPGSVNSNVRLSGAPMPLCFERGEGAYLYDLDGNRLVDFVLGMGPAILGHAPKPVLDAVAAALGRGQMLGGQHPAELELAKLLHTHIPNAEMLRLAMTGSEVVQAALRVARAATGRRKYIKFEGQYHGWFDNVLVSNAPPLEVADDPALPHPAHLETKGQSASVRDDVLLLPWNDLDAVRTALEAHGDEVAALITEPVMCNTGVIAPLPGYLEGLRELTAKHGVVFILDEVITGFRLALGGAQQFFGIKPDLSTFAKAMAAGFPIAALTGKRQLLEMFGNGSVNHAGTYNANIPSVVAAVATIKVLEADNGAALARANAAGEALIEGLRRLGQDAGVPLQVSGFGTVFNTYFAEPGHEVTNYSSYRRTDAKRQQAFLAGLVPAGVRPTARGTWFVSAAHGADETAAALDAAARSLKGMAG